LRGGTEPRGHRTHDPIELGARFAGGATVQTLLSARACRARLARPCLRSAARRGGPPRLRGTGRIRSRPSLQPRRTSRGACSRRRQTHDEARAAAGAWGVLDGAVVGLGDLFDEGEAETDTAVHAFAMPRGAVEG